jgi:iron complex transport system ATP-binding protein
MGLLARLCREQRKTVVMVGHDLNLAHSISTHALLLMGDGRWHAGSVDDAMQPALLSDYLGHPIEMIEHGGRRIFIPLEVHHA